MTFPALLLALVAAGPFTQSPPVPSKVLPSTDPSDRPAWAIAISDRIAARVAGAEPRQPSRELDRLYDQARQSHGDLKAKLASIAGATGGRVMIADELKRRDRAEEKIRDDYDGDASRLFDIVRGRIVYPTLGDLYRGLDEVERTMTVVRMKDRFARPLDNNYRDILLNVRMPNGHVGEVELHVEPIVAVANGEGHAIYEEQRKMPAKGKTPEQERRWQELQDRASRLYGEAWRRVRP